MGHGSEGDRGGGGRRGSETRRGGGGRRILVSTGDEIGDVLGRRGEAEKVGTKRGVAQAADPQTGEKQGGGTIRGRDGGHGGIKNRGKHNNTILWALAAGQDSVYCVEVGVGREKTAVEYVQKRFHGLGFDIKDDHASMRQGLTGQKNDARAEKRFTVGGRRDIAALCQVREVEAHRSLEGNARPAGGARLGVLPRK